MSDKSEDISFPGQVDLLTAKLIAYSGSIVDITAIIGELSVYEDIFSNTMSGHVTIQDANDLLNNLPLLGQEKFELEFQTPTLSQTVKKTFYVYKLQQRTTKKRLQTYILNFCSMELINSSNSKVAKAFSGNITDTVESIFRDGRYIDSTSLIYIDKTKNSYSFIAPYWTPIETINWLTGKSLNERGVANYLFFETNQSFEYVSVDTLVTADPVRKYIYSDVDSNTTFGAGESIEDKYNIVEKMDTAVTFDYLRNLNAGMYASTLYTFDMTTKNIKRTTYDYIDDFEKANHLQTEPLKTNDLFRKKLASIYFIEKNNYQTTAFKKQGYDEFFLQRNSLLEQLTAFKICIKVHGRTDIKAGNVISLKMKDFRELLSDEIETPDSDNDYYMAKYLITAIHHQIINGKHSMTMEIVSDSFVKKLTSRL